MKTDLYTKGILTVIAVALMVIAFKDFPPVANASDCVTSHDLIVSMNNLELNISQAINEAKFYIVNNFPI